MQFKDVIKVCLTGGPCAGKTTSLARIIQSFTPEFAVYTVPEMASMTFSSGVTIIPSSFTEEDSRKFTQSIIQAQIDMEKYFENLAATQRKRALIVTDRGCCDNFAYTSDDNKEKILDSNNWSMNFLSGSRYDAVIHLVTAASGAEEFYTLDNNVARSENDEQARTLDVKIQKQWNGHPRFYVIDNKQKGFEVKIKRVLDIIGDLTGVCQKYNVIKKFLIHPSFDLTQIPPEIKFDKFHELHTFLLTNKPKTQNYIFKRTYDSDPYPIYILVSRVIEEKYEKRLEKQRKMTEKAYFEAISSQRDPKFDHTKKSIVVFSAAIENAHNLYYIEKVSSKNSTFLILKVIRDSEHSSDNIVPSFIPVIEDITENPKFFSMNFANLELADQDKQDSGRYKRYSKESFDETSDKAE